MSRQEEWRQQAACRGVDVSVFFPVQESAVGEAKAICAVCPVRQECLDWALATHQEDGVWGGLTDVERRQVRRRRRTAARIKAA